MAKVNVIHFQITGLPHESGLYSLSLRNAGSTALTPSDAGTAMTAWRAFLNSFAAHIPLYCTWSPITQYKSFDVPTGHITDVQTATGVPASVTGAGSALSHAGGGLRINRFTSTIRGTRFMRGCYFLVPLASGSYDSTGEPSSTTKGDWATAIATFSAALTAAGLTEVVYGRPHPKGASNGVMADTTGGAPGTKAAVLRKRA